MLTATLLIAAGLGRLGFARGLVERDQTELAPALSCGLIGGGSMLIGFGIAWVFQSALSLKGYKWFGWAIGSVILVVAMSLIL